LERTERRRADLLDVRAQYTDRCRQARWNRNIDRKVLGSNVGNLDDAGDVRVAVEDAHIGARVNVTRNRAARRVRDDGWATGAWDLDGVLASDAGVNMVAVSIRCIGVHVGDVDREIRRCETESLADDGQHRVTVDKALASYGGDDRRKIVV
jgi:hypothetical protein